MYIYLLLLLVKRMAVRLLAAHNTVINSLGNNNNNNNPCRDERQQMPGVRGQYICTVELCIVWKIHKHRVPCRHRHSSARQKFGKKKKLPNRTRHDQKRKWTKMKIPEQNVAHRTQRFMYLNIICEEKRMATSMHSHSYIRKTRENNMRRAATTKMGRTICNKKIIMENRIWPRIMVKVYLVSNFDNTVMVADSTPRSTNDEVHPLAEMLPA